MLCACVCSCTVWISAPFRTGVPCFHRLCPSNACDRSSLRKRRLARVANFSPAVCCVQTAWTHLPREPQPRGHASVTKSRMQVSPFQFPAGHPRACPQHTHTHAPACLRARMLDCGRCAGVQPVCAGLQPPNRVHYQACRVHASRLALTFACMWQVGTQEATMRGRPPCERCSVKTVASVRVVLGQYGL